MPRVTVTALLLATAVVLHSCAPRTRTALIERSRELRPGDCEKRLLDAGIAERMLDSARCEFQVHPDLVAVVGLERVRVAFEEETAIALVGLDPDASPAPLEGSTFHSFGRSPHRLLRREASRDTAVVVLGPDTNHRLFLLDSAYLRPPDLEQLAAQHASGWPTTLCPNAEAKLSARVRMACHPPTAPAPDALDEPTFLSRLRWANELLSVPDGPTELDLERALELLEPFLQAPLLKDAADTRFRSAHVALRVIVLQRRSAAPGLVAALLAVFDPDVDHVNPTADEVTLDRRHLQRANGSGKDDRALPTTDALLACIQASARLESFAARRRPALLSKGHRHAAGLLDALVRTHACDPSPFAVKKKRAPDMLLRLDFLPLAEADHPALPVPFSLLRAGSHRPPFRVVDDGARDTFEVVVEKSEARLAVTGVGGPPEERRAWLRWHGEIRRLQEQGRMLENPMFGPVLTLLNQLPSRPERPVGPEDPAALRRWMVRGLYDLFGGPLSKLRAIGGPTLTDLERLRTRLAAEPVVSPPPGAPPFVPYRREQRRITLRAVPEIVLELPERYVCSLKPEFVEQSETIEVSEPEKIEGAFVWPALPRSERDVRRDMEARLQSVRAVCLLGALRSLESAAAGIRIDALRSSRDPDDHLEAAALAEIHQGAPVELFERALGLEPLVDVGMDPSRNR